MDCKRYPLSPGCSRIFPLPFLLIWYVCWAESPPQLYNVLNHVERGICAPVIGHVILELSSYVLEIPDDGYKTLGRNLIGFSARFKEYCKLTGRYWKMMRSLLWMLWHHIHVVIILPINPCHHTITKFSYKYTMLVTWLQWGYFIFI